MAKKKAPKKTFKGGAFPDPGASAWLGECLELCWIDGKSPDGIHSAEKTWEPKKDEWMFLWSPSLKAIWVCSFRHGTKCPNVSREGGAAKLFERFTARNAKQTQEMIVPAPQLKKLGKAKHIVYRSDKWNPGTQTDYIHDFGRDVQIWCGPDLKRPEIFFIQGGRLTVTERGIVY